MAQSVYIFSAFFHDHGNTMQIKQKHSVIKSYPLPLLREMLNLDRKQ